MSTRSGVNENTLAISGSFDKTIAVSIVALSEAKMGCPILITDVHTVDEEQTIFDNDKGPELDGQHPVSSSHQVHKPLILPCELEDTTDVNDTTPMNQIIDVELFTDHSSPISLMASYPKSIGGCIKVRHDLLQTEKALHLTIDENERLIGCLQSELLGVRRELDEEYSK